MKIHWYKKIEITLINILGRDTSKKLVRLKILSALKRNKSPEVEKINIIAKLVLNENMIFVKKTQ